MKNLFRRRSSREGGWLAISMQPGAMHFAHGMRDAAGKCSITRCGTRVMDAAFADAESVAKELEADRYRCLTLLAPDEYQLLLVEAPNVPTAELKTAIRWRVKDMLDYHVEDATIDVLDIPPDASSSSANRSHSMYAIAARNDVIKGCIGRFAAAHIPLSVIDIGETAQRNIAALFEPPGRGLAFLYVGASHALLTINFSGELYLARRIDVTASQLTAPSEALREDAKGRILLELQRSFDHFDRQFPFAGPAKLMLGPEPADTGMTGYLSENLGIPVEQARLDDVLGVDTGAILGGDAAWRLFPVLGAALRNEAKAL
jgi:MSHA biogenesis protein MshI